MRYSTNTIKKWKDRHYGSTKKNLHKIIDTTLTMSVLTNKYKLLYLTIVS